MEKTKYSIKIDTRTSGDIRDNIIDLAESYVPAWQYNEEDGDIGTALSRIFATEMEHNIDRYNQVIHKYHMEFVNMLDISLLSAKPAETVVLLNTPQTTMPGRSIKKGTKFIARDDSGEDSYMVFEASHDLYVTSTGISDVFMTDMATGNITPLMGEFKPQELVPDGFYKEEAHDGIDPLIESFGGFLIAEMGDDARFNDLSGTVAVRDEDEFTRLKPFFLFGEENGIQKNALIFKHPNLFAVKDNPIFVRIKGGERLIQGIVDGTYTFQYPGEEELTPFDEVSLLPDNETIRLVRHRDEKVLTDPANEDIKNSLIVLRANGPVTSSVKVDQLKFSAAGAPRSAVSVSADTRDVETGSFAPFGEILSLYQECFIGHDEYFSKAGAKITLDFDTVYFNTTVSLTAVEEEVQLKVIKRAPVNYLSDATAVACAQEVSFEYFNGTGWKKLPLRQDHRAIFSNDLMGHYRVEFDAPADWERAGVGAYEGRSIRITLLKSDNCYIRPCIHRYPVIKNLKISFTYEEKYKDAADTLAIRGTHRQNLNKKIRLGKGFEAFVPSMYGEDALYIGLNRRPEEGPVSILFIMEDNIRYENSDVFFEYSSSRGFKRMRVLDYSEKLSRSGMVLFMPPADMAAITLEGKKRFWIRITPPREHRGKKKAIFLPKITDICLNGINVKNINTLQEQEYFIDEITPFPQFALGVDNILNASVWVNEMGRYSREVMKDMLFENPEETRVEYSTSGEITSFYCLYHEVERLEGCGIKRAYFLDRMNSMITFGDGISTYIPRVMDDVAFRITLRTCNGNRGNIGTNTIQEAMQDLSYVEVVGNPVMAYGGSDIETQDSAMKRGANILSARRRLVSIRDYINEIYAFSDNIAKVDCITGDMVDGSYDREAISFVLLLRNHEAGSFVFHELAQSVLHHITDMCECTVYPGNIHIVEPIFVEVSVDIWAASIGIADSFSFQEILRDTMDRFLDPVGIEGLQNRDIGDLPAMSQIQLNLNVLKNKISVKKIMITAKYKDSTGTHEVDYQKLKKNPYMVVRSGKHNIHLMTEGM